MLISSCTIYPPVGLRYLVGHRGMSVHFEYFSASPWSSLSGRTTGVDWKEERRWETCVERIWTKSLSLWLTLYQSLTHLSAMLHSAVRDHDHVSSNVHARTRPPSTLGGNLKGLVDAEMRHAQSQTSRRHQTCSLLLHLHPEVRGLSCRPLSTHIVLELLATANRSRKNSRNGS